MKVPFSDSSTATIMEVIDMMDIILMLILTVTLPISIVLFLIIGNDNTLDTEKRIVVDLYTGALSSIIFFRHFYQSFNGGDTYG